MSVGAWTLVAFSNAAAASVFAETVNSRSAGSVVGDATVVLAAATGLVMSAYTGVLLGATALPVWSRNVRLLPIQFGGSGLGAAASLRELAGHRHRALHPDCVGRGRPTCSCRASTSHVARWTLDVYAIGMSCRRASVVPSARLFANRLIASSIADGSTLEKQIRISESPAASE